MLMYMYIMNSINQSSNELTYTKEIQKIHDAGILFVCFIFSVVVRLQY